MKNKGFTLVELIIVIAIMAILIAGIIFLIDPATQFKKARDGQRKSDLRQIQSALEMYRSDIGGYYTSSSLTNCTNSFGNSPTCDRIYLKTVPSDPKGGSYSYGATTSTYCLRACLENVNDSGKDTTNNFSCNAVSDCVSGTYSYTVQNP